MKERQLDVLFIEPNSSKSYQGLADKYAAIETPTWSLLLAQSCRAKGFGVDILDANSMRMDKVEVACNVVSMKPKLVVFVVYGQNPNSGTTNMSGAIEEAREIKAHNSSQKIAFVGSHSSAKPLDVLAYDCVDYVFTNEGVYALHNLLKFLNSNETEPYKVKGIGWKARAVEDDWAYSGVLNLPERVVPNDRMDIDLPGYAWDLLICNKKPFDRYRSHFWHANYDHEKTTPFAALYTSLGCQFKCNFCFPAGTKIVLSKDRNKKIEDVIVGDKLIGWDEDKSEMVETKVIKTSTRETNKIYTIELSDGKKVSCTKEHPFFVNGEWVEAGKLNEGDKVLVIEGSDKVSFRMKKYNPSFNKETAVKGAKTRKVNGHIPYLSTSEGRKVISKVAKKKALKNNPMKDPEIAKKHSEWMRGSNNPMWNGGSSKIGYSEDFTTRLKKKIRKRDGLKCQICSKDKCRLDVHHIDYNKSNSVECNLITLCMPCHMKTNYNREEWKELLTEKTLCYENCPHYVEVKSIFIKDENTKVYNIQCDPYHNFFAENILVHNCMINILNRTSNDSNAVASDFNVMRHWSPEFIIKEFDKLAEYGVETVRLVDEMFFLNKKYYDPLVDLLIDRGHNFNMWAYSRIDTCREDKLKKFKKAGINWLALGIESANQEIRQEITKGKFKDVNIREVVKSVQDADINVVGNYIFGFPNENIDHLIETLNLSLELNTEFANFYCAAALPGSPLYLEAEQNEWELPDSFEGYSFFSEQCKPLPTHHLSAAEVLSFRDKAWSIYYNNPGFLNMVESKFGLQNRKNIEEQAKIKLKRNLLED